MIRIIPRKKDNRKKDNPKPIKFSNFKLLIDTKRESIEHRFIKPWESGFLHYYEKFVYVRDCDDGVHYYYPSSEIIRVRMVETEDKL